MASKQLERAFVESFLERIDQDFRLVKEEEPPDFILADAHGSFGLEHGTGQGQA